MAAWLQNPHHAAVLNERHDLPSRTLQLTAYGQCRDRPLVDQSVYVGSRGNDLVHERFNRGGGPATLLQSKGERTGGVRAQWPRSPQDQPDVEG